MSDDERQLVPKTGYGQLIIPTDLVSRTIAHVKSLALRSGKTGALSITDIFQAIIRCDVEGVNRIVEAAPSVVFATNENGDYPLEYVIKKYISNDSYWRWISGKTPPPKYKPITTDSENIQAWQKSLWASFVKQELALRDIALVLFRNGSRNRDSTHDLELLNRNTTGTDIIHNEREVWGVLESDYQRYLHLLLEIESETFHINNNSTYPGYYGRAWQQELLGNWKDAISDYENAMLKADDLDDALLFLSELLYYCPDENFRNPKRAEELLTEKLVRMTILYFLQK